MPTSAPNWRKPRPSWTQSAVSRARGQRHHGLRRLADRIAPPRGNYPRPPEISLTTSALADKTLAPSDADLASILGRVECLWSELLGRLQAAYAPCTGAWKHYGKQARWTLQLKQKKRTLLYLVPQRGDFVAVIGLATRRSRPLGQFGSVGSSANCSERQSDTSRGPRCTCGYESQRTFKTSGGS
ncbi:MAG: DUF3788 family protein [Myxococcales bacterium]